MVSKNKSPFYYYWCQAQNYLELCKIRVVFLMLLTVLVGMHLATREAIPLTILLGGMFGIGFIAASAAVMNHMLDRHLDRMMERTRRRPIVSGRITPFQAFRFAFLLMLLGMGILYTFVNQLTAWLSLFTLVCYAGVYTLYLKRATPQNIVIGGAAGAFPPMLGWTAVTGHIHPHSLLLVLIIFVWTPPHFWALAIHRFEEYQKAHIPMLPVTHGIPFTKLNILLYTVLLFPVTLLPFIMGLSGFWYLIGAFCLNIIFLFYSSRLYAAKNNVMALPTFKFSIYYLFLLFLLLLVDHYIHG